MLTKDSLGSLMKQEIGFFDHEALGPGSLTSDVSSHPANVGVATGLVTSQVVLALTNVVGSTVLGMVVEWRTTLVCFPGIFLLFFCVCPNIFARVFVTKVRVLSFLGMGQHGHA